MKRTVEARVTHQFKASAAQVFDAWLDPQMVRAWMSLPSPRLGQMNVQRVEIDARVGGKFTFSDLRAEGEAVHWGYYRELDRPRRLVFTWFTSTEEDQEDSSVVAIDIEPTATGCTLHLVHTMDAQWEAYIQPTQAGWGSMLAQIDAYWTGQPA